MITKIIFENNPVFVYLKKNKQKHLGKGNTLLIITVQYLKFVFYFITYNNVLFKLFKVSLK